MASISHREMRNDSAEILRRVAAGEIIEVTNGGVPAAVLIPPNMDAYHRMLLAGRIKERVEPGAFFDIVSVDSATTVAQDLDALRGER